MRGYREMRNRLQVAMYLAKPVTGNAQPAAFNRQVAMCVAKRVGGWRVTRIGKFYNGRYHMTVCHAIRRIEAPRATHADVDSLEGVSRGNQIWSGKRFPRSSSSDPPECATGERRTLSTCLRHLVWSR